MKFSEAMRLGAMIGPQLFGQELSYEDPTASCAFGGAILAAGVPIKEIPISSGSLRPGTYAKISISLPDSWKPFCLSIQVCPACQMDALLALHVVAHLNDYHRWPREKIADWVAGIEAQQELQADALRGAEPKEVSA